MDGYGLDANPEDAEAILGFNTKHSMSDVLALISCNVVVQNVPVCNMRPEKFNVYMVLCVI